MSSEEVWLLILPEGIVILGTSTSFEFILLKATKY
jgi:hypothetical protein